MIGDKKSELENMEVQGCNTFKYTTFYFKNSLSYAVFLYQFCHIWFTKVIWIWWFLNYSPHFVAGIGESVSELYWWRYYTS